VTDYPFVKGHGTENDFVLLPDHDGSVHGHLSPEERSARVRALCDRRAGIGGDGVLRVVRDGAMWFMDYWNADGSVSEMCGNGIRVFARHLLEEGLVQADQPLPVQTRDGVKTITYAGDGSITVDMGVPQLLGTTAVSIGRATWSATHVDMGNPHAVAFVESLADAGTLVEEPGYDQKVYPHGVNIEFVDVRDAQHVAMRVHERGSGETRSCGTGACAVAAATANVQGDALPVTYQVDVPGGTLHVTVTADTRVVLTGPAEIVARGDMDWLS
jgi:diaminopimelate epimerase